MLALTSVLPLVMAILLIVYGGTSRCGRRPVPSAAM